MAFETAEAGGAATPKGTGSKGNMKAARGSQSHGSLGPSVGLKQRLETVRRGLRSLLRLQRCDEHARDPLVRGSVAMLLLMPGYLVGDALTQQQRSDLPRSDEHAARLASLPRCLETSRNRHRRRSSMAATARCRAPNHAYNQDAHPPSLPLPH